MIDSIKVAEFAKENGWLVVDKGDHYVRYLTPGGEKVEMEFNRDGSIERIYP